MNLKRVKFIYNPRSGLIKSPLILRTIIERVLQEGNLEYEFSETLYRGHGHEIAKEATTQGFDGIVAIGGDGTANEVGSALLRTGVAFGIIPVGSGNGLARGVGIPLSINRSARLLLSGTTRLIDAGKIENRYFFIITGVGFDALIGKIFDDRNIRGPIPYFTIGFREFFKYRPELFIIRFDDKQVIAPALFVTVANMKGWGAGANIAPRAKPDDGILEVCLLRRFKFIYGVFHLRKLFNGQIERVRIYEHYQAK